MVRTLGLAALALAASVTLPGEAAACFYSPGTTRIGPPLGPSEQAAAERQRARQMTAARLANARARLETGRDPALELAEMLVPNVRPIWIDHSDCGPRNEIDHAAGEETREELLAGTRFAGRADDFAVVWRAFDGESFGSMCNSEFRTRFASFLRRRLGAEQVDQAYLFLAARWHGTTDAAAPLRRLTAFAYSAWRPPLVWMTEEPWQEREIARWLRRVPAGRALKQAIDDFWWESAPLLDDSRAACPEAFARRGEAQARLVALFEAEEGRRRERRR